MCRIFINAILHSLLYVIDYFTRYFENNDGK